MSSVIDVATKREQRIDELRREGLQRVMIHLRLGHFDAAQEFLIQSVEKQARLAGVLDVRLPRWWER